MDDLEFTADFWDRHAAGYAKSPIKNVKDYEYTRERTRSYLGAEDRVLEVGAGTGTTALELAPSVAHITVTDISPAMMKIAEKKAVEAGVRNVDFVATEAHVPDLTGPYDAILAHNLLHLVEDLPGVLERYYALLKPGGVFISKTFCKPRGQIGPLIYYAMRVALPIMRLLGKAPYVAVMTIDQLEAAIKAPGFELVEAENYPASEIRRYIVARKPA